MPKVIAIVDDEDDLRWAVKRGLKREGYVVEDFSDAAGLLAFAAATSPDLFILDVMLPDTDGFEICRRIRSSPALARIPVIFLSARADEVDKVVGLELGADDYVTKPFSLKELAARVKARLRRTEEDGGSPEKTAEDNEELSLDADSLEASVCGRKVQLTLTEFKILQLLYGKRGKVFSRESILDYVWGENKEVFDRTIDVHIKNLREKIGACGKKIKNIRGVGYKYEA